MEFNHKKVQYNLEMCMHPFWQGDMVYNESVMMVADENGIPEAPLLFEPSEIMEVSNSLLTEKYEQGKDWVCEDNKLKLTKASKAAFMTRQELYPDEFNETGSRKKIDGGYLFYSRGHVVHDLQLAVTYRHRGKWEGPIPGYCGHLLPHTVTKLKQQERFTVVLYGDSISEGANVSGPMGASPYMPSWGDLVVQKLVRTYDTGIQFINSAKGGMTSKWGREKVELRAAEYNPGLVILAFGMNDGTFDVPVNEFESNIRYMTEKVSAVNPDAEFLLICSLIKNPEAEDISDSAAELREGYREVLLNMQTTGIAVADMASVHRALLTQKRYIDMSGNNINHPNDYLARWYAQYLYGMLSDQ